MRKKGFPLRKSRKILRTYFALLERKEATLTTRQKEILRRDLRDLDTAVLQKERLRASTLAEQIVQFCKEEGLRGRKEISRDVAWALVFAIAVAFVIRQFWFELYEVPTGSMRPTIRELDRLAVSKTTFGIHVPFYKKLLFYNPDLIQRAGIIVLTTADMDLADSNMLYFGLIPGKKRYVKRCVNKPGDTLYFYGGYIYGIDREGHLFTELCDPAFLAKHHLEKIDHVPMISFEGKTLLGARSMDGVYRSSTIKQMNVPVVQLKASESGEVEGLFFNQGQWVKDKPYDLRASHDYPISYSDLWGIGNFAMARLLDPLETQKFYGIKASQETPLFLELHHSPNATFPKPMIRRGEQGRFYPMLTPYITLIPLNQDHLRALSKAMITTQFCVRDGHAYPYQKWRRRSQPSEFDIRLPGAHNGCYEFYYGKGYRITAGGFRRTLLPTDPLYELDPTLIKTLFNTGIGWNRLYEPIAPYQPYHPHRYAYFREGDLYVMGAPVLKKDDPTLKAFVEEELKKQQQSTNRAPYVAFVDHGPPDLETIRAFGLKIPDHAVVGLGDNYAASSDSRDFGFIPVNNLRGAPSFIFWPISSRLGPLAQPPYPWMTVPNLIIWSLATVTIVICVVFYRKRNRTSLF